MDKRIWLFIKKYIYSGKKGWLNSDTFITLTGLIISVTILTTVLSIFSGYEKLLRKTILGVNDHIYIFSMKNDLLTKTQVNRAKSFLLKQPEVKSLSLLTTKEVLVSKNKKVKGAILRGINPDSTNLSSYIIKGKNMLTKDSVILGYRLADYLNLKVGDKIKIVLPQSAIFSVFGVKNKRENYTVAGLYRSGMYEYDSSFIFANKMATDLFPEKDKYTLIGIKLHDNYVEKASYLAYKWANILGVEYQINSWIDYNGNLFSLLTLEKWVIFIIISFLVLISSFNIISSITTSILKERKKIGILKTLGMENNLLKKIFLYRTIFTSLIAVLLGECLGIIVSYIVTKQKFFQLKGDVYFIDKITADYNLLNFVIIIVVSVTIIFFASLIPLRKISKLKVIDILRT